MTSEVGKYLFRAVVVVCHDQVRCQIIQVPDVEVAAARMSNESALTHDLLDTKKTLVRLDAGPGWMS